MRIRLKDGAMVEIRQGKKEDLPLFIYREDAEDYIEYTIYDTEDDNEACETHTIPIKGDFENSNINYLIKEVIFNIYGNYDTAGIKKVAENA